MNLDDNKEIKMFFKGKPFKDEQTIDELSIIANN
jgi:hypothetical protein